MRVFAGFERLHVRPYVWASALVAAGLSLLATVKGPGLSTDSVTYLATGVNLAESRGLTTLDGTPLTLFPPLLPVVAAAAEVVGLGAQTGVRLLLAVCAAALVVVAHLVMRRAPMRPSVLVGATVITAVSPVVIGMSKMAWTDLPFMVMTVVFVLLCGRSWRSGQVTPGTVVVLVGLCWIAFALRYAGLVLVVAGAIMLLVAIRPVSPGKVVGVGVFVALATAAPLAWMLRNRSVDGTWFGHREPSPDGPAFVVGRVARTVGTWVVPVQRLPAALLVTIGSISLVVIGVQFVRRARSSPRYERSWWHRRDDLVTGCGPSVVFSAVYLGWLATAQLTTALDPIDSRLLAPVYVPLVLVSAVAVSPLVDRLADSPRHTPARRLAAAVAALFLLGQFAVTARDVRTGVVSGIGYNSDRWRQSELGGLTENAVGLFHAVDVYTNETGGLWAATGIRRVRPAPRFAGVRGIATEGELAAFSDDVRCSERPVMLVMFDGGDERVHSVDEIGAVAELSVVSTASDGVLYRVEASGSTICVTATD